MEQILPQNLWKEPTLPISWSLLPGSRTVRQYLSLVLATQSVVLCQSILKRQEHTLCPTQSWHLITTCWGRCSDQKVSSLGAETRDLSHYTPYTPAPNCLEDILFHKCWLKEWPLPRKMQDSRLPAGLGRRLHTAHEVQKNTSLVFLIRF